MEKFEKDNNIMHGKGESDDVTWVTINGAHIPIKDNQSLKKSTEGLTKRKKNNIVELDKWEYAKFCHAIRTRYADKIPKKGHIFLDNYFCFFRYIKQTERLVCTMHIPIEENRELISMYVGGKNGKDNG